MLIRFSSIETESITMFGDVAIKLIKMLGASGAVPSAIAAKEIPAAIERLQHALQAQEPERNESTDSERNREPPVALATRAHPLIDLLRRAAAADVPVMWDRA